MWIMHSKATYTLNKQKERDYVRDRKLSNILGVKENHLLYNLCGCVCGLQIGNFAAFCGSPTCLIY